MYRNVAKLLHKLVPNREMSKRSLGLLAALHVAQINFGLCLDVIVPVL
jgi:hypothetical protein